jgi:orotate phosphoribosyltransferase
MEQNEIIQLFKDKGALLEGHYMLSSGLHSDKYFQAALVLQYPLLAEQLAKELGNKIISSMGENQFDIVISPAMGGLIIGHEMGRFFRRRAIFAERVDGKLTLRRGFTLAPHLRCLVVEDVITTGLSTKEVIEIIKTNNALPVAVASIVDRNGGKVDFGIPKHSLVTIDINTYQPDACTLCAKSVTLVKPGSRTPLK